MKRDVAAFKSPHICFKTFETVQDMLETFHYYDLHELKLFQTFLTRFCACWANLP